MRTLGISPLCLRCGTEGGKQHAGEVSPRRTRGLCDTCYWHCHGTAELRDYPEVDVEAPEYVLSLPYSDYQRRFVLLFDRKGVPQPRALPFAPDYSIDATIAEAEEFAARWLDEHPAHAARYGSPQERAA
jgi:hypothetical protein